MLNLLIKPIWILVEMEIQDVVGHDAWGLYAALFSLGFLLLVIADLGINPYTTQKLASEPELLKKHVSSLLSAKLFLLLLYPCIMLGVGYMLGYRAMELYFLGLISFTHAGLQLLEFFRANFRAMQRFQIDAFLSVFERLLLLILIGFLFYKGLNIERFIYARIFTMGLGAIFCYILLIRLYGKIPLRLDTSFLKKAIQASWPFAMMTVLYSIHDKVDQVMLERISGQEETGLYAAAYRWIDAFSMYLWTVLPIFFARFAFYLHDKSQQEKLLNFGQVIVSLPMIFIAIFGLFHGEKLLFLFDRSSAEEVGVMSQSLHVLFYALLINGSFTIYSTLLTSTGEVRFVNRIILLSILLNVGLNLYFIPQYGALACAWSTVASFLLANIAYVLYATIYKRIHFPVRQFLLLGVTGLLTYGAFFVGQQQEVPWLITTLASGLMCLGFAFASGLLRMKDLRSFKSGSSAD